MIYRIIRRITVVVVLKVLSRAFCSASRFDSIVRKEISAWPDGFTFTMIVQPHGPSISLMKMNGKLFASSVKQEMCDLIVSFKNHEAAFLMFTARISTAQGYCEKRIYVSGDIPAAMSLIRSLAVIERYLFPAFLARRVMKRLPPIGFCRLTWGRLRLCTLGLLLGR